MAIKSPFMQESSNVYMKNKLLMAVVIVIALSSIYDSIQIGNIRDTQETIILPYGDVDPYVLRHDHANMAYVRDMAKYIIFLYTNHSAVSVKEQYSVLLGMFDPQSLPRYQQKLNEMSMDYANYVNISHIGNVKKAGAISVLKNVITINYEQSRVAGTSVQPPISKQLIVHYKIRNARFWITDMAERELAIELQENEE